MDYHPQAHAWIEEFKELYPQRKLLFFYKAGSHFFDLNTPDSDLDYRGVYLPGPDEFVKKKNGDYENRRKQHERKTNDVKHTQNSNDDVDFLLFSFTKVLDLLKRGDFNVMEMLYAPEDKILIDSPLMQELRGFKQNLLVNDVSAFLGFIKKEYVRYGVNINHYGAQIKLLKFLKEKASKLEKGTASRMHEIWDDLKEYGKDDPLIVFTQSLTGNNKSVPTVKVAQRLYQWTVKIGYVIDAIEYRIEMYGHRQKKMAETGKEYKGLYHALRLIYEAQDLFDFGELNLPFSRDRLDTLMMIKLGLMEQDKVHKLIDDGIEEIYYREKNTPSNRHIVESRIDRLLFRYQGKMELTRIFQGRENERQK